MRSLLALAFLLPPGLAAADPVEDLLGGYEFVAPREAWQRLGPAAAVRLREIALDRAHLTSTRARAISALAHFPTAETRRFLEDLLAREDAPSLLRRKGAIALAHGFGAAAVDALAAQAGARDVRLRDDVARALGLAGGPRARALLEARLAVEDTFVRRTLSRALALAGSRP